MPTLKKRLNISLSKELEDQIQFLAERDQVPQATKALHLLKTAIEIEEDDVFNKLAGGRDTSNAEYIDHEEVWS